MSYIFIIGGIVAIALSANWLVDGASSLAKRFGISDIVIGLTVVAFGTSAPELTINLISAFKGSTDIAIGNILGSNIMNIFLILGISAIIHPLVIQKNTTWKEIPLSLLAAVVLGIMANDVWLNNDPAGNSISVIDGLVLLCFFIIFLVYTLEIARNQPELEENIPKMPIWKALVFIGISLVGLFFGGKYFVEGAIDIATQWGMSERVIGLTIVAIGTSLPELATSVVAAFKKNADIAVGNAVGSNLFNIFLILGTTAVIKPLPFSVESNFDIGVAILASLMLFLTTLTFGRKKVDRVEGGIFLLLFIAYIIYIL